MGTLHKTHDILKILTASMKRRDSPNNGQKGDKSPGVENHRVTLRQQMSPNSSLHKVLNSNRCKHYVTSVPR
jgi:hypothetical protein